MPTIKPGLSPEAIARRMAEVDEALKKMQANPRVSNIVVVVPADACPACRKISGTYPKDKVPRLPIEACTHPLGCRSFYQPFLNQIFP